MKKIKKASSYYNKNTNLYGVVDNGEVKIYAFRREDGIVKMKFVRSYVIGSLTQEELVKMTTTKGEVKTW